MSDDKKKKDKDKDEDEPGIQPLEGEEPPPVPPGETSGPGK